VLCDANAHIYYYEAGGPAALSGVICRLLPGVRGVFSSNDVEATLRPRDDHFPPTRLLTIENTHNRGGGKVWPLTAIREVCQTAHDHNIRTHLDGARLWNAAVASGTTESDYASNFDSISVCFSKGLGAPAGSALAGGSDFIKEARRVRKQLGGAMRQVGIIAGGALHALNHHRQRLVEDHDNAEELARGLGEISGLQINPVEVETNMVYFDVESGPASILVEKLQQRGVLMLATSPTRIRAVTSLALESGDIAQALRAVREVS
jgi:threonine aldolase